MKQLAIGELKTLEIINRIPFFKDFNVSERKSFISQNIVFLQCWAKQNLIHQGDKETSFYIILSGEAKVVVNKNVVTKIGPGYFIGEGAFINSHPRTATVTAITDMLVLKLDQPALHQFPAVIREKIKDQIIAGMAMRLHDMNNKHFQKS